MNTHHQNILVIKLGALGDFIQALGPMAAIRKHHKDARITLLTTQPFEGFAKQCGYFDSVWIDGRPRWHNITGWMNLKKKLSQGNFTRVYDLQNNDRTSFYFKLFKKKPEWVGAAKGASHRNSSPARTAGHAFDGHVQTLKAAGIENIDIDDLCWVKADVSKFNLKKPYVLFVPGSAPAHPGKRWPAENYAALARIIAEQGYQIVILGTENEKDAADIILKACPEALDLTAKTSLFQIAALARDADNAIGNDTGPMHLIAATGCKSLALFSEKSNPVKHGLKGKNVQIIRKRNIEEISIEEVLGVFRAKRTAA